MSDNSVPSKACFRCGIEKPRTLEYFVKKSRNKDGMDNICRECDRIYKREFAQKQRMTIPGFRELEASRLKQSRDHHRQEYNEAQRMYYAEWIERPGNREHKNVRQRSSRNLRIAKPGYSEYLSKLSLAYYHLRAQSPEYRRQRSVLAHKRRTRIANSTEHYTYEDEKLQFKSQKGLCWWCGKPLDRNKYDVDHITPVSRGGSNSARNIVIAHPTCNKRKHNKMAWEWIGRLI